MASRPSPNSLIHCAVCGEDYSATYKRCPFCGAKNAPPPPPPRKPPVRRPEPEPEADQEPAPAPDRRPADPDDTYVFDGQDVFDNEYGDDYTPRHHKGGKRLAEGGSSMPFGGADVNWPRVITHVCSLVIIIAALVIVFTWIYPQLRDGRDPVADGSESPTETVAGDPAAVTGDPAAATGEPVAPIHTDAPDPVDSADPGTAVTEPPVEPTLDVPPPTAAPGGLSAISFKGAHDDDFTLNPDESHRITLAFSPADWSGSVSWSSTNPEWATVDENGTVTNVNTTSKLHAVTITIRAEGLTLQSTVYCKGVSSDVPASDSPATEPPAQSDPPAGGGVTVGRSGTIVNAAGGLRVRSGPGTSNAVLATLRNGDPITVVANAGDGWYQITFSGPGGAATEGYIMGEYISTN